MSIPSDLVQDLVTLVENGDVAPKKKRTSLNTKLTNKLKAIYGVPELLLPKETEADALTDTEQKEILEKLHTHTLSRKSSFISDTEENIVAEQGVILAQIPKESKHVPLIGDTSPDALASIVTRKEVESLKKALIDVSDSMKLKFDSAQGNVKELLQIVANEQKIYDKVFTELINQVSRNMSERGQVLELLRDRYSEMFQRIPASVKIMYSDLVTQRELNRRMKEELAHVQGRMSAVLEDMQAIQPDAEEKPEEDESTKHKDKVDNSVALSKYLDLYTLRLDRLEKALKTAEEERFFWMEGTKFLISKTAKETQNILLLDFHRSEQTRYLSINSKISEINDLTNDHLRNADMRFKKYAYDFSELTDRIETQNENSIRILKSLYEDIISFHRIIVERLQEAEKMKPVQKLVNFDHRMIYSRMTIWQGNLSEITACYTSDKEQKNIDELQKSIDNVEYVFTELKSLLATYLCTPNPKEFQRISDFLDTLIETFRDLHLFVKRRILGENGVLSSLIWLQNQLEDSILRQCTDIRNGDLLLKWSKTIQETQATMETGSGIDQGDMIVQLNDFINHLRNQTDNCLLNLKDTNNAYHKNVVGWMLTFISSHEFYKKMDDITSLIPKIQKVQEMIKAIPLKDSKYPELALPTLDVWIEQVAKLTAYKNSHH